MFFLSDFRISQKLPRCQTSDNIASLTAFSTVDGITPDQKTFTCFRHISLLRGGVFIAIIKHRESLFNH